NPFFVVEALAAGADGIPETIRDAVLARASQLTPDARLLLEAVAVVPPHAESWLLTALVDDELSSLDECLASGMLRLDETGVRFRHEPARRAIEEAIPAPRRLDLHKCALTALEMVTPDLDRLSHHAEATGDAAAVLRYAPAAGARAFARGAYHEAAA